MNDNHLCGDDLTVYHSMSQRLPAYCQAMVDNPSAPEMDGCVYIYILTLGGMDIFCDFPSPKLASGAMSPPSIQDDITYSKAVLAGAWAEGLLFGRP